MSTWTLEVGKWPIVWTGFLQGVGAGIIWVPMQALVFPTLPAAQRTEAAAVLNLVRSLGSSIGVSLALTLLTRTTTVARAGLVEHLTPYNPLLRYADVARSWDLRSLGGLAQAQRQVEQQAAMLAYNADFRLLALAALVALPLLLFIPRPRRA